MLRTHIISLKRDADPVFPDWCVGCGMSTPNEEVTSSDRNFSWFAILWSPAQFFTKRVSATAPICARCKRRDTRKKWLRRLVVVAVAIVSVATLFPWVETWDVPGWAHHWLGFLLFIVVLAPIYIWMLFHPRAFSIEAMGDEVEYHFARSSYASAFADLNADAIHE